MATKEKKQIAERTAIKAIITGYVGYGLIFFFLYNLLKSTISSAILENIESNLGALGYIMPIIFGIITVILIHFLCRLSTIDLFRKCKMDVSKTKYVVKNLKIFFVLVIIFSIFYTFTSLYISLQLDVQSIAMSKAEYLQVFTPAFANKLTNEMLADYNSFRDYAFKDAFISEIFFVIGIVSLSSFQRKMIEEYNAGEEPDTKAEIDLGKTEEAAS